MNGFKDHFSTVSDHYARSRPTYPPELFAWLAEQCRERDLAWDCGAGSGQASAALADFFTKVVATDASAGQIAQAQPHPRIDYRQARAEASGLESASVDLVTVAQALHWFDPEPFHAEVRRVLKPGGVVAAWCYGVLRVEGEAVNDLAWDFYANQVGPHWPPERRLVENGYRDLSFPFQGIEPPAFAITVAWNLEQLLGYFASWSATARYRQVHGVDPVERLVPGLRAVWGDPERSRRVTWPISLRVGR